MAWAHGSDSRALFTGDLSVRCVLMGGSCMVACIDVLALLCILLHKAESLKDQ